MLANNARTPEHNSPIPSQPEPFIGVCGIRSETDYRMLAFHAPNTLQGTDAFIMAGIKERAVRISQTYLNPLVRPFIHCDYSKDEHYSRTITDTLEQTGEFAEGLQLNVLPWMDTSYRRTLTVAKQYYPDTRLVLQAHRDIMERHRPEAVAKELATLPADYVLFDPSQSRGEDYNLSIMRRFITAAQRFAPWMGIVVAGGLGSPESMKSLYAPLVQEGHTLSCDAFLKLQSHDGTHLEWPAVRSYLQDWREIYTGVSSGSESIRQKLLHTTSRYQQAPTSTPHGSV